jgi:hypothetical protein
LLVKSKHCTGKEVLNPFKRLFLKPNITES